MREIRFRAWDKTKKRMAEVTSLHPKCSDMNEMVVVRDETGESVDTLFDNYVVMQYTGLKDKNGKEIFGGDILKGSQYFGLGVVKPHTLNPARIVVVFEDQPRNYLFDDLVSDDAPQWDITGNIYETPNLLTNEK
jgi:YopX protein